MPIIKVAYAAIKGQVGDPIDLDSFLHIDCVLYDNSTTNAEELVSKWAQKRSQDLGEPYRVVSIKEESVYLCPKK